MTNANLAPMWTGESQLQGTDGRKPVIELEHVHKIYVSGLTPVHALRDVSLVVEPGEFVAIMGASGSGKSTMLNVLGCLDRPSRGWYYLDGIDVSKMTADQRADIRNRKLGFVFQGFNLLSRTSAIENVELPLLYSNVPAAERLKRSRAALAMVGLAHREQNHPSQLSGGQQQRVAIARSLVNRPALLLADEPTGNLDTRTSIDIMNVLQQLNRERGLTIVMVTHEPDIAEYTKRVVMMRDGRIIRNYPVKNIRNAAEELDNLPPAEEEVLL